MSAGKENAEFPIQKIDDYTLFIQKNSKLFTSGSILLLSGKVGAGKTAFVKAVVEVLHQKQNAKSPTFALHHHYQGNPNIEHWDLYRLTSEEDLESSGFWDQFQDRSSLIIVEWPERLQQEWLPQNWQINHLNIKVTTGLSRCLKLLSGSAAVAE